MTPIADDDTYRDETLIMRGPHRLKMLKRLTLTQLIAYSEDPKMAIYIQERGYQKKPTEPAKKEPCIKFKYPDRTSAIKHLRKIRKVKQDHEKPVREYQCDFCGFWHLTSRGK